MPKKLFLDELTGNERMVMKLIGSEISLANMKRLPLKTIFLQPQYFQIFEDLNKKCFTEQEIAESDAKYMISKVHIEKGTFLQQKPATTDYWPVTIKDREKNREAIGRRSLYEA